MAIDTVAALLQHQTLFLRHVRDEAQQILAAREEPNSPSSYAHENFKYAALSLVVLYRLRHPANTLRGEPWVKELAIQLIARWLEDFEGRTLPSMRYMSILCEWPAYILSQAVELLGEEMDPQLRERSRRFVVAWAELGMKEPFFYTAPNHEAWRSLALWRAGTVFAEKSWQDRALFFTRQLCRLQTHEGFWEEVRHHGPSMKYNCLMLSPLAWLYRLTGDEELRAPVERLARFMARWTFPDGTTVGAFDGRQSTSPAFFGPVCPGLELIGEGVTLNQRGLELWELRGMLSEARNLGPSIWYAHFSSFYFADAIRYYAEAAGETPPAKPLAVDSDVRSIENHSYSFDAVLRRQGAWTLAASGQMSDLLKDAPDVFRLERQSRLELWHQSAGVILGGGHNLAGAAVPLANVVMATDHDGRVEYGQVDPPDTSASRSLYLPRALETAMEGDRCRLTLHFGHGSVSWLGWAQDDGRFILQADWHLAGATRLCLQLPMVLWQGGELCADGRPLDAAATALSEPVHRVEMTDHRLGAGTQLLVPSVGQTRIRPGLEPLRTYGKLFPVEHFDTPFRIILVSTQIDEPPASGSARWEVTVGTIVEKLGH